MMKRLSDEIDTIDRWVHRHKSRQPVAVVLGASINGLAVVRSLGRHGVPVLLIDRTPQLGGWTRFARRVAFDGELHEGETMLELLVGLGQRLAQPAVIFPTADGQCTFLADHHFELEHYYKFVQPEPETVRAILDRPKQYEIAKRAGVSIPGTFTPANEGDDTDIYGYWAFWDEEGRERAWLTMRKPRQNLPRFCDGTLQQTVTAPEVARLSRKLLRAFEYRGLVGVEFKRDNRDGSFKLMEITPRIESANQLAVSAGVDLAWIAYRHLTDTSVSGERVSFTPGVTFVNEEADFKRILELRKAGELKTSDWLRSWFSARAHALGAWDDPMPLIVLAGRIARAATKRRLGLAE
jgi:predicted ATP-grasp superfamily ATP-dependent carboligase